MNRAINLVVVATFLAATTAGCGSEYTIVDRSTLTVSENARVSAASILPGGQRNPRATNHLALAQEVYQKQLDLLKERRNKVRARRRTLDLASFAALAAVSIGVGAVALASENRDTQKMAGAVALSGVGLGTGLQIGGLFQEEPSSVEQKIHHLQTIYDAMTDRVRVLAGQPQSEQNDAAVGATIESFINEALQINVKG
jgi:hypothetical protein